MTHLSQRRSIRKYAPRDVDEALLERLLREAERTQTMGNLQLYSVVVTRRPDMKERLAPCHYHQPMVTQAPVVLTFCADTHRTTRWCDERQATPGFDNFLSFVNGATDALLYCQTFCQLAEEEGLGLCFLGTTFYQPAEIARILGLPKLVMPVATITLGWPDEEPQQPDRLPLEAIVHAEQYADYSAERIDRLYHYKESLPENQEFVTINHQQTLAQVFADVRYTRSDNEALSATFLQALKQQGFL